MPVRLFELGELHIASKSSKQPLALTCSISLDLPASMNEQIGVKDLVEMTKSGQLWIAKATTCRLEVAASVQGVAVITTEAEAVPTLLRFILDVIAGCTVSLPPFLLASIPSKHNSSGKIWA
jgi:hypothetical protein